jgi:hypothetical protein
MGAACLPFATRSFAPIRGSDAPPKSGNTRSFSPWDDKPGAIAATVMGPAMSDACMCQMKCPESDVGPKTAISRSGALPSSVPVEVAVGVDLPVIMGS